MKTILRRVLPAAAILLIIGILIGVFRHDSSHIDDSRDESTNYVVYEAVFLDREEVQQAVEAVRGPAPAYKNVPEYFHVTTQYLPEEDAREFYGTKVKVKITGYKAGEVQDESGKITHNEGLRAELFSDSEALNQYLEQCTGPFHITLSYEDKAFNTASLDFSDAKNMDIELTGTFGAYVNFKYITFTDQF